MQSSHGENVGLGLSFFKYFLHFDSKISVSTSMISLGSAPDVGDPIGWHVDLKAFQPWGFQLVVHDKMV